MVTDIIIFKPPPNKSSRAAAAYTPAAYNESTKWGFAQNYSNQMQFEEKTFKIDSIWLFVLVQMIPIVCNIAVEK